MSNLSILLVALHCAVYIYSKISGVDSRPPDYEPSRPFTDDATEATRAVTEYKENLQRQLVPILKRKFNRLPGVCRRLKRRRITVLVLHFCLLLVCILVQTRLSCIICMKVIAYNSSKILELKG
uniref:Si:ch211-191i18.4 n=1 Tax=Sinocyclocheilus rhinocerous TaxID=307959 RepID=A0A673JTW5_9TELE